MPRQCIILAMTAGVRLSQQSQARGKACPTFAVTSLRNESRRLFASLADAKCAFQEEVEASRADPRVGPYVR